MMDDRERIREEVRVRYTANAGGATTCCEGLRGLVDRGYRPEDLAALPEEVVMGLGCGSPTGRAELQPGETVVDLGSGGGLDVFLAAQRVGPAGRVIGVDMTDAMVVRAEISADRLGLKNVEFRRGLIEALPLPDVFADVILSNCVVNLAPDKGTVFREAFRVLKPGGRLVISDMVATAKLPKEIREDPESWASCIGGAIPEEEYIAAIRSAGFVGVEILDGNGIGAGPVYSVTIRATKPVARPEEAPLPSMAAPRSRSC